METPNFVLVEHAAGYGLFRMKEFEEIGQIVPQVRSLKLLIHGLLLR